MKLWNKRQDPKVLVVFARDRETLEEDFVGLALDREQELRVRDAVESPKLERLTEEVRLQGWEGGYSEDHEPEIVYLVFCGGRAQNQGHSADDFDPEIYGASVDRKEAEWFAEKDRYIGQAIKPLHVWELKPGWISSNLRWD